MTTRPHCRNCGKSIPKETNVVWFGHAKENRSKLYWIELTDKPTTREEAQRLVNGEITSVASWAGNISRVSVWDGKSFIDQYFCTGSCAQAFGRMCAKNHPSIMTVDYVKATGVR